VNPRADHTGQGWWRVECVVELLRKRMLAMKEVVLSNYYRFYPPIFVHDLNLSLPITENMECDFNTLAKDLKAIAFIYGTELEDYGPYLGYLKYYVNAPFDIFDDEKNVETLKILLKR
jgi:hypothetical protein